jgi:hypothetical protein
VRTLESAAQAARRSRSLRLGARLGLLARGVFYLLLAYLAAATAGRSDPPGAGQANANGALTAVAATPLGVVALAGAAVGFAAFGLVRLAGAYGDRTNGRLRRLTTVGQAAFYLAMALVTASFLLGRRETGSNEQQQSTTVALITHPAGRLALAAAGVAVAGVTGWQLWLALRGGFADSLRTREMGERLRTATIVVGALGIAARALAVLPVGVLLVVAAALADPDRARGLDQLLAQLNQSGPGRVLVWVIAAGFLVFAAYSFLEARYRQVHAGN